MTSPTPVLPVERHTDLTDEQITAIAEQFEVGSRMSPNWGFAWLDFARAILAANQASALPLPEGWQPISTAPKGPLVKFDHNSYGPHILGWTGAETVRCRWWHHAGGGTNFIADGGRACHPTHWQHLPAAPLLVQPEGGRVMTLSLRKIEEAARESLSAFEITEWYTPSELIRDRNPLVASDAPHIANMDPATVLALVAVAQAAMAWINSPTRGPEEALRDAVKPFKE